MALTALVAPLSACDACDPPPVPSHTHAPRVMPSDVDASIAPFLKGAYDCSSRVGPLEGCMAFHDWVLSEDKVFATEAGQRAVFALTTHGDERLRTLGLSKPPPLASPVFHERANAERLAATLEGESSPENRALEARWIGLFDASALDLAALWKKVVANEDEGARAGLAAGAFAGNTPASSPLLYAVIGPLLDDPSKRARDAARAALEGAIDSHAKLACAPFAAALAGPFGLELLGTKALACEGLDDALLGRIEREQRDAADGAPPPRAVWMADALLASCSRGGSSTAKRVAAKRRAFELAVVFARSSDAVLREESLEALAACDPKAARAELARAAGDRDENVASAAKRELAKLDPHGP